MTQFEKAMEAVENGTLQAPSVHMNGGTLGYVGVQLCSHEFYMKVFARGMTARQINLKTLKEYYGLKKRSAKDCLVEFQKIKDAYEEKMKQKRQASLN